MDTLGAVIGPALALLYLYFHPGNYKALFLIAFAPGVAAIVCTLLIKEKKKPLPANAPRTTINVFSFVTYWKNSPIQYKKLVMGLLLFALFNSSDVFLLLKMKESGLKDIAVIGVYIFYNFMYALLAYPAGIVADRLGMKKIFLLGLFIFALVYTGFAFNNNLVVFIILFALYGLYAAATEGVSKAWISNIVDKNETATAIGTYTGFQSIAGLLASSISGLLWYNFGAAATFLITAAITLLVIIYIATRNDFNKSLPIKV
jgi:MFS family permease